MQLDPAEPLPLGFRVALDERVRRVGAGDVLGGRPARLLKLSGAGRTVLDGLLGQGVTDRPGAVLGRRLLDAGVLHPTPAPQPAGGRAAVVVPVRDAVADLDRCLAALGDGAPVIVVDDGSADPAAVDRVARRHGARLVRRAVAGGPAAARNAGVTALPDEAAFVAFVDSDVVVRRGWLDRLLGHFADPAVGAVAPRVAGAPPLDGSGVVARFAAARSPLDLGGDPGPVRPGAAVAYLPSAALVVRRDALAAIGGFDAALRFGEDVDLIWRLHDAGWRVRYDPTEQVTHREPSRLAPLLRRRFAYGRSAGPLARRHPGRLAPLRARPWPLAVAGLAMLGPAPAPAAVVAAAGAGVAARRLHRSGVPASETARLIAAGASGTARALSRVTAQLLLPAALTAAAVDRRRRLPLLALLAADPVARWWVERPPVDPVRWTLLSLADEAAYGTGVWAGALQQRTAGPVLPSFR